MIYKSNSDIDINNNNSQKELSSIGRISSFCFFDNDRIIIYVKISFSI